MFATVSTCLLRNRLGFVHSQLALLLERTAQLLCTLGLLLLVPSPLLGYSVLLLCVHLATHIRTNRRREMRPLRL